MVRPRVGSRITFKVTGNTLLNPDTNYIRCSSPEIEVGVIAIAKNNEDVSALLIANIASLIESDPRNELLDVSHFLYHGDDVSTAKYHALTGRTKSGEIISMNCTLIKISIPLVDDETRNVD
jgi:hypothetical protein